MFLPSNVSQRRRLPRPHRPRSPPIGLAMRSARRTTSDSRACRGAGSSRPRTARRARATARSGSGSAECDSSPRRSSRSAPAPTAAATAAQATSRGTNCSRPHPSDSICRSRRCDGSGNCQPLPLSDFGTVKFTGTSATAGDHTGPISDAAWSPHALALDSAQSDYSGVGFASTGEAAGATPSSLSADGSSFKVSTVGGDQSSVPSGLYGGSAGGDGQAPIVVWIYG